MLLKRMLTSVPAESVVRSVREACAAPTAASPTMAQSCVPLQEYPTAKFVCVVETVWNSSEVSRALDPVPTV